MRRKLEKCLCLLLVFVFVLTGSTQFVQAAAPALSKKSVTLEKGASYTLKLKNVSAKAKKKAVWTTSDKKTVSVTQSGRITAKEAGKATIRVSVSGKKLSCKVTVTEKAQSTADDFATQVVTLVNKERAAQGLPALSINKTLMNAAKKRSVEMQQSSQFSHTRPDGSSCFTVLAEYNISYMAAGENIAMGYTTPQAVVEGWMNSPGHRANILSEDFTMIGVGYYKNYWTQLFIG